MNKFERFSGGFELRSESGQPRKFFGYGAVFYDGTPATEYQLSEGVVERFQPTAFDDFLNSSNECISLYDHQPDRMLAMRSNNSLRIGKDSKGLYYEFEVDNDDIDHRDVVSKSKRGLIKGSSVIFRAEARGQQFHREGNRIIRDLNSVSLAEIGPTWKPCYTATTAELRSLQDACSIALPEPPTPAEFWAIMSGAR